jgi:hypothetical protein
VDVFILSLGTRGDVELFVMLGRALRRRGHRVVLGTSPFYAATVRDAGLGFTAIGHGAREELLTVLRSLASVSGGAERTRAFYRGWRQPQLAAAMNRPPRRERPPAPSSATSSSCSGVATRSSPARP